MGLKFGAAPDFYTFLRLNQVSKSLQGDILKRRVKGRKISSCRFQILNLLRKEYIYDKHIMTEIYGVKVHAKSVLQSSCISKFLWKIFRDTGAKVGKDLKWKFWNKIHQTVTICNGSVLKIWQKEREKSLE